MTTNVITPPRLPSHPTAEPSYIYPQVQTQQPLRVGSTVTISIGTGTFINPSNYQPGICPIFKKKLNGRIWSFILVWGKDNNSLLLFHIDIVWSDVSNNCAKCINGQLGLRNITLKGNITARIERMRGDAVRISTTGQNTGFFLYKSSYTPQWSLLKHLSPCVASQFALMISNVMSYDCAIRMDHLHSPPLGTQPAMFMSSQMGQ